MDYNHHLEIENHSLKMIQKTRIILKTTNQNKAPSDI